MSVLKKIVDDIICKASETRSSNEDLSHDHSPFDLKSFIRSSLSGEGESTRTRIESEFFGLGPLEVLFQSEKFKEILILSNQNIWFENDFGFHRMEDTFLSTVSFHNFIGRVCRGMNQDISAKLPFVSGNFCGYRFHIVGPPITDDFQVCIRNLESKNWTLKELAQKGWATPSQIKILESLIQNHANLLVVGPTSSGKTTTLNALLTLVSNSERILVLEDAQELLLPNLLSSRLTTRSDPQGVLPSVQLSDLVVQAMRMRPDRLVMGEVRGAEAKDLLMALATGHSGSMGTLHALSCSESLTRLEMLIQLGAPQWGLSAIRKLIALSIHAVIVVGKENEKRMIKSVHRICGYEEFGIVTEEIK